MDKNEKKEKLEKKKKKKKLFAECFIVALDKAPLCRVFLLRARQRCLIIN
jgi:hypothetical protein